jgi:hypothetical protein
MFYVIPSHIRITDCGKDHHPEAKAHHTLAAAKAFAGELAAKYGNHWQIVKVETVWTITTLPTG